MLNKNDLKLRNGMNIEVEDFSMYMEFSKKQVKNWCSKATGSTSDPRLSRGMNFKVQLIREIEDHMYK
jgi:hypothetical protein